jgi:hypothetical protein
MAGQAAQSTSCTNGVVIHQRRAGVFAEEAGRVHFKRNAKPLIVATNVAKRHGCPEQPPNESKNRHAKHLRYIHKIGAVLCVYGRGSQAEPCKRRGSNNPSAASGMKRRPVQSDKRLNRTLKTNTFWLAQLKSHVRPSNEARHRWTQPPPHTETTKPRRSTGRTVVTAHHNR